MSSKVTFRCSQGVIILSIFKTALLVQGLSCQTMTFKAQLSSFKFAPWVLHVTKMRYSMSLNQIAGPHVTISNKMICI